MTVQLEDNLSRMSWPPLSSTPPLPKGSEYLLKHLPAVYAANDFMEQFLCIFEDTLKPLRHLAADLHYYFNPLMAPAELLDWLAAWVNLTLDESWPVDKRRRLIAAASELYSMRGTRRGMVEYLRLYTGVEPEISEYVDGMVLGPQTFLGVNTLIAGQESHSFTVTLRLDEEDESRRAALEASIRRIIEAEKPAHTAYRLNLLTGVGSAKSTPGWDEAGQRVDGERPPSPSPSPASSVSSEAQPGGNGNDSTASTADGSLQSQPTHDGNGSESVGGHSHHKAGEEKQ